ncbi:MAG TPA: transcription termination/antitermination protein NusA [Treponema sp.]|jgi:N utilization substance protein A|nr:transcription termination factor NusA [Treponema sp.]HAK69684.1 transcription termination/antitermination protein NusA [Treponema sp.]HBB42298.1 transcription termination/antitermination protein NusA [Treponema sp.]HCA20399.1 transcription termination/antitermination protein NusA [Treponema sp.]
MSEMADAIRALAVEKGISEDAVKQIVENMIKAAYKGSFKTDENCIVKFNDDMSDVHVYSRKKIVDVAYSEVDEIELDDVIQLSADAQIGDEIDIEIDPRTFARKAIATGKSNAHQAFKESVTDNLYNEYKDKIGTIVIGNYQREYKGNIYVDLGKSNVEGFLPLKYQSPREVYQHKEDRVSGLVTEIKRTSSGIQLVMNRSDPKFVELVVEREVPEVADKTIGIYKISRETGYRTKIAVFSNKLDVDPVGSCVGLKGTRIQNVTTELEGEKIDVCRYSEEPHEFIKEALKPAEVKKVILTDIDKKEAVAIVAENQFSLAIGKQGQNVRLANKLCDWNIDVKTEEQAADMDLTEAETRRAADALFGAEEEYEEVATVAQLPDVDQRVAELLKNAGIEEIEDFMDAVENGSALQIEGITEADIEAVNKIINENVVFEDEEEEAGDTAAEDDGQEEEDELVCPECGAKITMDMTRCPKCGVELEFQED